MRRIFWVLSLLLAVGLVVSAESPVAKARGDATKGQTAGIDRPDVPPPSRHGGTWTAKILVRSRAYRRPGGRQVAGVLRPATPWSGSAQYLMVLRSAFHKGRQWLLLRLPDRPNNARGWVLRDRVVLSHSPHFLELSLSRRRLVVFKNGRRTAAFRAVIGHRRTPTPIGLFAVLERVRQPDSDGFLGPWAIHLTSHSEVLRRFDGGPGRIAIHGRGGDSLRDPLGSARSNGCIRINNGPVRRIARLLPGTAVRVVR